MIKTFRLIEVFIVYAQITKPKAPGAVAAKIKITRRRRDASAHALRLCRVALVTHRAVSLPQAVRPLAPDSRPARSSLFEEVRLIAYGITLLLSIEYQRNVPLSKPMLSHSRK